MATGDASRIPDPATDPSLTLSLSPADSGAHMGRQIAGLRYVRLRDMRNQTQDLTSYLWEYQVGLVGEKFKIFAQNGSNNVHPTSIGSTFYQPLTWYKTTFDAPPGADPVAINLGSMA